MVVVNVTPSTVVAVTVNVDGACPPLSSHSPALALQVAEPVLEKPLARRDISPGLIVIVMEESSRCGKVRTSTLTESRVTPTALGVGVAISRSGSKSALADAYSMYGLVPTRARTYIVPPDAGAKRQEEGVTEHGTDDWVPDESTQIHSRAETALPSVE